MTEQHDIVVLGAGLSGLAASQRLVAAGAEVRVYEKAAHVGGIASSRRVNGFTFDHGPHVSFTSRPDIRDLLARAVGGRFRECRTAALNHWNGWWIPHPAQCHLFGLPAHLVEDCIVDFVERQPLDPSNYAEWCEANLGKAFSREFTFRYTRKYWTVAPQELTADWVGKRVHAPSLREVIGGAIARKNADQHYIGGFRYPTEGGYGAYLAAVCSNQTVCLNEQAVEWNPERREIRFQTGLLVRYRQLVSSIPLPMLISMSTSAPDDVREAARRLACTSVVLVNVGLERSDGFPDADWMYFYDDDVAFARAHMPHRLSPDNAPAGCGSIQVEVYHSPAKPRPRGDIVESVVGQLRACGMIEDSDRILLAEAVELPFANIIHDHQRSAALATTRAFVAQHGVELCGRFGEWEYFWSDDSIVSGFGAAERILSPR